MGTFYPRCRALLRVLFETFDGGTGDEVFAVDVIPRSAEIERNTFREADTFSMQLDYKDFPFDPRTIRSVLIAIHMGQRLDAEPLKRLGLGRSSRAFIGYVDVPRTTFSDAGEVVAFTGRDYTGIFLDYTWPQKEPINITRPLTLVLGGILQAVPGAEELEFEFSDGAESARFAILSGIVGRTKWTPKGDKDDAWTVISDLLAELGLLPVIELDRLIVKAPGEFSDQHPVFVYGRDIAKLEISRKFNEVRTQQIEVTTWDEQAGETRSAKWPEQQLVIGKKVAPKSGKATPIVAPITTYTVSGSHTQADLLAIAKRVYEDGAREQFEGSLETMEVLGQDASGNVLSITRLGNGDSITVKLGTDAHASITGLTVEEGARVLSDGPDRMDPRVALALARSLRLSDRLQSTFYVKTARHEFGRDTGYKASIDFINFVGVGHA